MSKACGDGSSSAPAAGTCATIPVLRHQIDRVWLWRDWPGRWGPDAGIDLVAKTPFGDLWAVQAKAYAANASVTKADIDTFLSESSRPQFALRLLIATTDHVSANARRTIEAQEKPVRLVLASDLAKATLDWPSGPDVLRAAPLPRKSPRAHQEAAVRDVLAGFEHADRGQLIMACGTGKTMVGLWAWELLDAQTAMVVLPSLSLLAQTVREWCANARLDFDFLAVCSDESVIDADITVRRASELPFATTTSAESIASFLRSTAKAKRVLFSTYQSAPRVAEALALSERQLDLLIADEAHRCAGRVDASFSMVLKDGQLPSRRRLFMTATPRYLSGRLKRAAGELDVEVVSMDDEAVFGAVFHRLTFGQAIAQELLSDYRVAIIGVQDEECLAMAQRAALVRHGDRQVADARTLAAQAALLKGIAEVRPQALRDLSFASSPRQNFANTLREVAASLPADMRPAVGCGPAMFGRNEELPRDAHLTGCAPRGLRERPAGQRSLPCRGHRRARPGRRGFHRSARLPGRYRAGGRPCHPQGR